MNADDLIRRQESQPGAEPTASATTDPTTAPSPASNGLGGGAVAGVAVGCLFGGLLIGIAIAWFLFRRKKPQQYQPAPIPLSSEPKEHSSTSAKSTPTARGSDFQLDQFLLDATPDQEMADELRSLGDLVQQHVENHYHFKPVQAGALKEGLLKLGYAGSGLSADAAASLCADPRTRALGLRHVISHVVFRSIDVDSRSSISMLPAPIGAFLQSMPANKHGNAHATTLALSQWRRLSAFLLHSHAEQRTPLSVPEAAVSMQAGSLAKVLDTFLAYFRESGDMGHLQGVIVECTKLGYVLLSHPSDFRFVFDSGSSSSAVVCPGLDKLSQRDGTRYSSPRRVVAPVAVQV